MTYQDKLMKLLKLERQPDAKEREPEITALFEDIMMALGAVDAANELMCMIQEEIEDEMEGSTDGCAN